LESLDSAWCNRASVQLIRNLRFQEEGDRIPRRSILPVAERESLLALPDTTDELIRRYTFSESDLSVIRQRRGPANRLGFAVQLCYLRFPGVILGVDEPPFPPLLKLVAEQLKVGAESWDEYGQREQTRREHLVEFQKVFGFQPFTMSRYRRAVQMLTELAMQTDKGIVLASALIEHLRRQSIILPELNAIERVSSEAITRANQRIYAALSDPLSDALKLRAAPAAKDVLHAIDVLRGMNADNAWKVPADAPTGFIRKR
jgi:hypothetical protein